MQYIPKSNSGNNAMTTTEQLKDDEFNYFHIPHVAKTISRQCNNNEIAKFMHWIKKVDHTSKRSWKNDNGTMLQLLIQYWCLIGRKRGFLLLSPRIEPIPMRLVFESVSLSLCHLRVREMYWFRLLGCVSSVQSTKSPFVELTLYLFI